MSSDSTSAVCDPTPLSPTPIEGGWTLVPDFAPVERLWLGWPCLVFEDEVRGLQAAQEAIARLARTLRGFCAVTLICPPGQLSDAALAVGRGIDVLPLPINTGRLRDTGPSFVRQAGSGALAGVDWVFNGWGGLAQGLEKDDGIAGQLLDHLRLPRFRAPLVCEGGAIQGDGEGTLIVTEEFLRHDRRDIGYGRREVERLLLAYTGSTTLITVPRGLSGDTLVGHVDPVVRFIAPGRVVLSAAPADADHPDHDSLTAAATVLSAVRDAQGRALEVIALPLPAASATQCEGAPSVRSYTDFLVAGGALIVPTFNDPADREAGRLLAAAMPDYEVVRVSAHDIADVGGSLRALTLPQPVAHAQTAEAA